ncbi:GntR family transcriptional regulator [Cryptosporangium sp. NPDC051539]|uniref:GntR family transcriptional regulator n=1 Tax=Cryptosporangium sp. NPDC051539 TaxID=3363962 RepID=UPI003789A481
MARSKNNSTWSVPTVAERTAAPLRAQAAEALRNAILSLALPEGERLVERELIERLGVSRTTVREALRELESEGLVEVIPQRGAVVASITPADAADLYAARVAIEALVVRHFVERADDETVDELVAAVDAYAEIADDDHEVPEMLTAKDVFYGVLGRGAASPALWQLLSGLQGRVRVLRARSLSQPGRPVQSAEELKALARAIRMRDAELAARRCSDHVHAAADTGLPTLNAVHEEPADAAS